MRFAEEGETGRGDGGVQSDGLERAQRALPPVLKKLGGVSTAQTVETEIQTPPEVLHQRWARQFDS